LGSVSIKAVRRTLMKLSPCLTLIFQRTFVGWKVFQIKNQTAKHL
jgi:hypothetical protein